MTNLSIPFADQDADSIASLSADTADSVLPVAMDRAWVNTFMGKFFATRRAPEGRPTRSSYYAACGRAAEIQAFISSIFATLRSAVAMAATKPSVEHTAKAFQTLSQNATASLNLHLAALKEDNNKLVRDYASGLRGKHTITQAGDNWIANFSGLPPDNVTGGGLLRLELGTGKSQYFPENAEEAKYSPVPDFYNSETGVIGRPLFKAAMEAAQLCHKFLYGSEWVMDASHKRTSNFQKLDFDGLELVNGLNKVFAKHVPGLVVFGPDFKLSPIEPLLNQALGSYLAISLIREANHQAVKAKNFQNSTAKASNALPPAVTDSMEIMTLHPDLGASIALLFTDEEARFITQSPKGSKVSLYAFDVWLTAWAATYITAPGNKGKKKGAGTSGPKRRSLIYVIPPSQLDKLTEKRRKLGYMLEPGRNDDSNITISPDGRFYWVPKTDGVSTENAKALEQITEEILRLSYEAGTPSIMSRGGETHPVFAAASPHYRESIRELKSRVEKFAGSFQGMDWNYNVCLFSSADGTSLSNMSLLGTTTPDELPKYNYLAMEAGKSLKILFKPPGGENANYYLDDSDEVRDIGYLYAYLFGAHKLKSLQEYFKAVVDERELKPQKEEPYEVGLYGNVLADNEWNVKESLLAPPKEVGSARDLANAFITLFRDAMRDANGSFNSNLSKLSADEGITSKDNERYFNSQYSNLNEISRVYSYAGGEVFRRVCADILAINPSELLKVDPQYEVTPINVQRLMTRVMPFMTIIAKYAPDFEAISLKAEQLKEANSRNTSITADELKFPGIRKGQQMFPHQVATHQQLRNYPRYAVLDISPGGGKSALGATDIMDVVGSKKITSLPLILCPTGLVKNWCEEIHKFSDSHWNVIPLTRDSFNDWGEEKLEEMIKKAPRNTIIVCGISILSLGMQRLCIGNYVDTNSMVLEFVKKFGFQYILFDESHKAKRVSTRVHKSVKQLMTCSCVRFVRIGTGTLIKDRLTDVIGQAALFDASIFRTAEEYAEENMEVKNGGAVWTKDAPAKARAHLAAHVALISVKRKEWAFMLPMPIETFISVNLQKTDDNGDLDDEDVAGKAHRLMYQAVLQRTLEAIKADKDVMRLLSGKDEDNEGPGDEPADDEDQDDEDADEEVASSASDIGGLLSGNNDLDDATLTALEALLKPYLARLEQMLVDPLGDEFGEQYFEGIDMSSFVSVKTRKIIERIALNFTDFPWEKGNAYSMRALCDYEGQRYALVGKNNEKYAYDFKYVSVTTPDKDPMWKPEPRGKVIVFCRYTRSVTAIYKALPEKLRKVATMFHGEVKDKWTPFELFKSTPWSMDKGVQILIANEQAIAEGHNLQMASRMIRCESPWGPGDLDQSASRIFRPDPSGKFTRDAVYLDWIITNNTLEVPKMARLISKILVKAQFDEAGNDRYNEINEIQLPLVSLSLDTIRAIPSLSAIEPYTEAYRSFIGIQAAEFREMRQNGPTAMLDIPETPIFEDARIMDEIPYVPNQIIPDRDGFGFDSFTDYLSDPDDPEVKAIIRDKRLLIGRYAHCQFGNGVISKVTLSRKSPEDNFDDDRARGLSSVTIKLASGEEVTMRATKAYIAKSVPNDKKAKFTGKVSKLTKADKERLARNAAADEVAEETRATRSAKAAKAEQDARTKQKQAQQASSVEKATRHSAKKIQPVKPQPLEVQLYAVVYNGFLALEAVVDNEEEQEKMDEFGFSNFGEYAYVKIRDKASFDAIITFLDKKFALSRPTQVRMRKLENAFSAGRVQKFSVDLADTASFRNFYIEKHRKAARDEETGKMELRVHPVVVNDQLILAIDMGTNPTFRRYVKMAIPGSKSKFELASGLSVKFFNNKAALVSETKTLRADAGIEITNYADLVEEIKELSTKKGKSNANQR